jgi:pimeloyl-ACP methyl ester carboxylesterase
VSEGAFPIWQEALFGVELLLLHASPVYYGIGIPKGDGSAVILVPGFLGSDLYLVELFAWLRRIGYRPYYSGIGLNADCPNLLIRYGLRQTIQQARRETRRKAHVIGHSLGGLLARAVVAENPRQFGSVITLGSPFRGTVLHPSLRGVVESVREQILVNRGPTVLPDCYTGRCTCSFLSSLRQDMPDPILETAVYSKSDGLVDWRYCVTGHPKKDVEVSGTHIGLAFSPLAYGVIAERLAQARRRKSAK